MRRLALAAAAVAALTGCTELGALFRHGPQAAPNAAPEAAVVVSLPDTTINLSGDDGFSYLRIEIAVTVAGPMSTDALRQLADARKAAMLDVLNSVVQGQRFSRLRTPDGRRALAERLRAGFDSVLAPARARQVFFEEFVAD